MTPRVYKRWLPFRVHSQRIPSSPRRLPLILLPLSQLSIILSNLIPPPNIVLLIQYSPDSVRLGVSSYPVELLIMGDVVPSSSVGARGVALTGNGMDEKDEK